MQTGIYYCFGYPIPCDERCKMIYESGFNNVYFWWGDNDIEIDGPKETIAETARDCGLYVENVHAPHIDIANLIWEDTVSSEGLFEKYKDCITGCYDHQIPTMVLHLTQGFAPPAPSNTGIDRIKYLVDLAEQKNINIALENVARLDYLDFVYSNVQSDRLKFCYDSGHENCYTKGSNILSKYGDKLVALHLHDNDGISDQHCIPTDGSINWNDVVISLKKLQYKGSISLEITSEHLPKYKDVTAKKFLETAYSEASKIAKQFL